MFCFSDAVTAFSFLLFLPRSFGDKYGYTDIPFAFQFEVDLAFLLGWVLAL